MFFHIFHLFFVIFSPVLKLFSFVFVILSILTHFLVFLGIIHKTYLPFLEIILGNSYCIKLGNLI